jgi:hypothetical protein
VIAEGLAGLQAVCSSIGMLKRDEWLKRYRVHMLSRCPEVEEGTLAELTSNEVYSDLVGDYPDNPERAIDDELEGCESTYGSR